MTSTIKVGYDGKDAEKGLSKLKGTVNTVISAFALQQMASYTLELAKLGATAQTVDKSFNKFAADRGKNADQMMKDMRRATLGMVNDLELQQKAMQAMISGVSFDDMITAMEFVTKFAATTGQDVNVKMQSVMTGLARKSAQFLDDVGIQVMGAQDVVGAAIDQMKEKMGQFNVSAEDTSAKVGQLKSNFDNLKSTIGQQLVPTFNVLIDVANEFLKVEDSKKIKEVNKEIEEQEDALRSLYDQLIKGPGVFGTFANKIDKIFGGSDLLDEKRLMQMIDVGEKELKRLEKKRQEISKSEQPSTLKEALARQRLTFKELRQEERDSQDKIDKEKEKNRRRLEEEERKANLKRVEENKKTLEWLEAQESEFVNTLSAFQGQTKDVYAETAKSRTEITKEEWERQFVVSQDAINNLKVLRAESTENQFDEEIEITNQKYNELLEIYAGNEEMINLLVEARGLEKAEITKRINEQILEDERLAAQERLNLYNQALDGASTIAGAIGQIQTMSTNHQLAELDRQYAGRKNDEKAMKAYERRRADLMNKAAQDSYNMALFQQGVAVAKTTAYAASTIAASAESGAEQSGWIGALLAGVAAAAEMAVFIAMAASEPVPSAPTFQTGLDPASFSRGRDSFMGMINPREAIIPEPQSAMHREEITSIINNTANTKMGGSNKQAPVVYNFYGVSTDTVLQAQTQNQRLNRKTLKL